MAVSLTFLASVDLDSLERGLALSPDAPLLESVRRCPLNFPLEDVRVKAAFHHSISKVGVIGVICDC